MLTPSTHATVRPFYAFGNTPAVSLTESLPQGVDADILLLGCGDVRHILYTCYAEKGLPKRKLDVTACDIEPMIIARNILLLSLIVKGPGEEAVGSEQIWRIYYHQYLDSEDSELLLKQAEKLLGHSGSLTEWNGSVYGAVIRFVDDNTFSLIRDIWRRWSSAAAKKDDPRYKKQFESDRKASNEFKQKAWGPAGFSYSSAKAGAPMFSTMFGMLTQASETYWKIGLSDPKQSTSGLYPNPLFALAISAIRPLAFADPTLSFHLAPAHAKLTELSPLRLADQTPEDLKVFRTAQLLFKEWTGAFKQLASESRAVVRFTVADCYSLCQTLQCYNDSGSLSGNWFQRESSLEVLKLAEVEYQGSGKTPTKFDAIDTSNISDYSGALTLLVSAGPLLKNKPWSTLYTELMSRDGDADIRKKFEALLCEHTTTIALMLGLVPIEYWTNATALSVMDVAMAAMMDRSERGGVKMQARVAWKLDRYLPGSLPGGETISSLALRMDAEDVANHAFHVYSKMFKHENLSTFAGLTTKSAGKDIMSKNLPFPKYHRGTFVAYLKAVCQSVQTDAGAVGRLLLFKAQSDTSSTLGSNHLQALAIELFSSGVHTDLNLVSTIQRHNTQASFCKWKQIPPTVAVTIIVPAARWQPVYRTARNQDMTLVLEGNVKCSGVNAHHNIFSDVQIAFGTVTTEGSRQDDDFRLTVNEDQDGWLGNSSLIASFSVNTAGLQIDILSTKVSLGIQQSVQAIASFSRDLGMYLCVFEASLLDESRVYVTKYRPGQTGHHVVCGSNSVTKPNVNASTAGQGVTYTVNISPNTGDVTGITGHVDITTEKGKQYLADKTPITLKQATPFTINVVTGAGVIPPYELTYPVPVLKDSCKQRIARKSCYFELIAPIPFPLNHPGLDKLFFPTVLYDASGTPATLNIPHLSLDTLPILALDDKGRIGFLNPLTVFMFSPRELAIRKQITQNSLSPSVRANFKESLMSMIKLSAGLQGGESGLFGLSLPDTGVHMLVMVSAIRLDGPAANIVLDAAVLPLTDELVKSHKLDDFLLVIQTLEMVSMDLNQDELNLWKTALPAFAERCRTWEHLPTCEYVKEKRIPLNIKNGQPVLCSCGTGHFPENYSPLPDWDLAKKYATRVAISPVSCSAFVEDIVDPALVGATGEKEECRACGRGEAKESGGKLLMCTRCKKVKYCSKECQKGDWKTHRMECAEA
ncbi:MYND finger [Podospora aff. communis PSN243]|uniref:MYND finger n=1 Tax=Podospora aff. communis PSN243 TaxID=3040156 RepID=A0AAV9GEG8_9PEZI|nr:MYND finger [Podospora aff. communis PSN243]